MAFWDERGFSVKNVYRDQAKEPFHKEKLNNGVRLYIGDKDVRLGNGIFAYTIEYETSRQLIFATDRDELYWNINGNGWIFTSDTVSCTIHFPEKAVIKDYRCYTGVQGSKDADCKGNQLSSNEISFVNTRRFDAYEGMTVAVGIEKGSDCCSILVCKSPGFPESQLHYSIVDIDRYFFCVLLLLCVEKKGT
jgi:hypothetical protein